MGPIARFFSELPQESFSEVDAQRAAIPAGDPRQGPLSVEDRRASTRGMMGESLPLGLTMMALAPFEQAGKAAMAAPVVGPIVESVLRGVGLYQGSRSGFQNPIESIGGTWAGGLQGLNDRGMFGQR